MKEIVDAVKEGGDKLKIGERSATDVAGTMGGALLIGKSGDVAVGTYFSMPEWYNPDYAKYGWEGFVRCISFRFTPRRD